MRGELKISLPNRGRMFSAQRFHVAALAAGCCLAVAAETMYTDADGTTFDVTDRVLTVTTPAGASNTYNYVTFLSAVTNVVKAGPGILVASADASYTGDWHFNAGEFHFSNTVGVFGKQGTAAGESNGRVFIAAGASIRATKSGSISYDVLKYKDVYLAGTGTGSGTAKGAIVGVTGSGDQSLCDVRIHLMDDATYYQPGRPLKLNNCNVDTAGKVFTFSTAGGGGRIFINGDTVVTNSSETPSTMNLHANSTKYYLGPATWKGGPENIIDARRIAYPLYISSACVSDWTLLIGNGSFGGATKKGPGYTSYSWDGPIVFSDTTTFTGNGSGEAGATVTLKGALSGDSSAAWTLTRGFCLNIMSSENTFGGAVSMNNSQGGDYRTRIQMYSGSVFSAKSLSINSADFYMADDTAFTLPAVSHTAGDCLVTGGASGTTIVSVTKSGDGTLTLDTPADVAGGITLNAGTLALGTRTPAVGSLACAAGTTLDMGGNDWTIGVLSGCPTLANAGKLTVTGRWDMVVGATPAVWDEHIVVPQGYPVRVSSAGGNLSAGETVVMYVPAGMTPPNVASFYGVTAAGSSATFELRAVAEGDYAGYTALVATVTAGVASATWAATSAGGAYETPSNWENEAVPATGAAVSFPAAARAGVAVTKAADSVVGGIVFGGGAGSSVMTADWFSGFGYSFGGVGRIILGNDAAKITSSGGVNTVSAPIIGSGTLTVTTDLYPFTNVANAVYSRTILKEDALAGFTGTIVANPTQKGNYLAGHTELHTGSFAGKLSAGFGETSVDSLAFVKSKDDLTLGNYGTLNYTGPDAAIPGLTWAVDNAFAISNAHDLTVAELSTGTKNGALFKAGAGTLAICGTGNAYFAKQDANSGSAYGFPNEFGAQGRVAMVRYKSINVCDGTLKVGVLGDSENTPSIQAKSLAMGQGYVSTGTARFQLDNGTVTLSGNIFMGFYVQNEAQSAVREFVVNGGSLTAEAVSGARLGYNNLTRGRHAFEVNGGTFTLNGPFDLTQLSPGGSKNNSLRESMKHTLTMNGGECSCTIFRMGYSYGLTWDNKLSDNNGYGHGWQPDAYLTMNGGTMTISDHLLAGDRRDSRSWTILNGGVLKVNMLTNTYATATAATDDGAANFIFNGGVYAPIGDGDVPDELVMKRLTTAVVSTNGAVFATDYLPEGATFTIEQALTHDPLCGDEEDGGLTKTGAGRLVLAGDNTFTGPLRVTGGTLAVAAEGCVASKAAAISGDGVLELDDGVVLKLDSLLIDGEPSRYGIFGGAESVGNKLYAAHFAGKGVVQVGAVGTLLIFR